MAMQTNIEKDQTKIDIIDVGGCRTYNGTIDHRKKMIIQTGGKGLSKRRRVDF